MEEMQNVVEDEVVEPAPESEKPSVGKRIWSGIKEWCRKFVVKLKRRPMNIAFFVLIVSAIVYLCSLGNFSQTALNVHVEWLGLSVFVNTLFCILSLLLFMNSFPKRSKKPKIVMLVLLFVFIAAMITFDIVFYVRSSNAFHNDVEAGYLEGQSKAEMEEYLLPALSATIAHVVLVGLAAILTATYPLYGKLINKINTRKVIESTELKEEIDTTEEV